MFTEDMTTCTGTSYHVNPDAPEEGTDIHHDESCPTHGPLSPVQVAIRKRQMAHRLGYRDGYYGKPSRGYIVCGGDFDLIAIYNDAKDRGFSDHRNGVAFGD